MQDVRDNYTLDELIDIQMNTDRERYPKKFNQVSALLELKLETPKVEH